MANVSSNPFPVKIAILARGLSEPFGGVRQFMEDIIRALVEVDADNLYFIYYNSHASRLGFNRPNVKEIVFPCKNKLLFDHLVFPWLIRKSKPDIVYCPKNVIPLGISAKTVVTIHDLLYYPIPGKIHIREYNLPDTLYMRFFIKRSARKATHIHAISENTKQDILALFDVPEEKISVIYHGVSSFMHPFPEYNEIQSVLKQLGLRQPYIFYAGTFTPRKNVPVLIRTFGRIQNDIPHHLVMTGGPDKNNDNILKIIKKNGIFHRTHILGNVNPKQLKALYAGADIFVFPSLYEGFGLPVLEAMVAGCPVICANTSSLPEVVGNAAIMFNPHSETDLDDKILELTTNSMLQKNVISDGLRQLQRFSYFQSAINLKDTFANTTNLGTTFCYMNTG